MCSDIKLDDQNESVFTSGVCTRRRAVPQRLKHQTQVLFVVEMPEETQAVEFIIGIGVVELLQELQFLQSRLLPVSGQVTAQVISKPQDMKAL